MSAITVAVLGLIWAVAVVALTHYYFSTKAQQAAQEHEARMKRMDKDYDTLMEELE